MNSCAPIIQLCRHTLSSGRRCQQPAVGRRTCCRHHLDAQARLHNMARARRCSSIPRICVPMNRHDLARNKAEINRLINTGGVDYATARMMLWAMDLANATLHAESAYRPRRAQNRPSNRNGIYDVPLNPLFPRSLSETLSQMIENTERQGEGYTNPAELAKSERRIANRDDRRAPSSRHL